MGEFALMFPGEELFKYYKNSLLIATLKIIQK